MPSGPDFFRFASDEEFDALFGDQGLDDRRVQTIEFTLSVPSAGEYWDGLLGGTVRMSALVLGQPELPVSAKLASGRKP